MQEQHGAFGQDRFGQWAERAARFFGTPQYIVGQTVIVVFWIILNSIAVIRHWDPYPFILLNLAFSTQAAYTGPVLLLAGNRQSQKDRLTLEHAADEADKADLQNVQILKAIAEVTGMTEKNTEVTIQILKHVETLVQENVDELVAAGKRRKVPRT